MNFSQDGILLIDRRINFSAHSTISKLWSILIDPSIGQPGHDRCDRLAVKSRSTSSTSTRRTSYFRKFLNRKRRTYMSHTFPEAKFWKKPIEISVHYFFFKKKRSIQFHLVHFSLKETLPNSSKAVSIKNFDISNAACYYNLM